MDRQRIRVRVNYDDLEKLHRGERIKILRVIAGLHQRQLAERVGVSLGAVSAWERGAYAPSDVTLWRLARVLGVPAAVLATPAPGEEMSEEEKEEERGEF